MRTRVVLAASGLRDHANAQRQMGGSSVPYPRRNILALLFCSVPVVAQFAVGTRDVGWPVITVLRGFASPGTLYGSLADAWAARGVSTTSTFDNVGQERDGRALFPAVVAANAAGPFAVAFDVGRIALAGHSRGGGNVGNAVVVTVGP